MKCHTSYPTRLNFESLNAIPRFVRLLPHQANDVLEQLEMQVRLKLWVEESDLKHVLYPISVLNPINLGFFHTPPDTLPAFPLPCMQPFDGAPPPRVLDISDTHAAFMESLSANKVCNRFFLCAVNGDDNN